MSSTHIDTQQPTTPSLSRFGAAALGLLHNHVELLGLELQEQKSRSLQTLAFAAFALLCAWLLLIALSALVLIALWDDYRLHSIIGLCLFYGLLLALSLWQLRKRLNNPVNPFSATLSELARDREQLLP